MDPSSLPPETADAVLDAYTCGLFDPGAGAGGDGNVRLLGPMTLGVEVTVPELARRCGLGNIDPQHGGGVGAGTADTAAIEACLTVTPPPAGATLVTVRPDLDAFGAMALLVFAGRAVLRVPPCGRGSNPSGRRAER